MFWTGVLVMLDHCVMPAFVCMTLPALACFLASSASGTETRFGGAYYRPCFSTGMDFYRILGIAPFGPNPSCFGSRPYSCRIVTTTGLSFCIHLPVLAYFLTSSESLIIIIRSILPNPTNLDVISILGSKADVGFYGTFGIAPYV